MRLAVLIIILLAGCATAPKLSSTQTTQANALHNELNAKWASKEITSQEVLETEYAIRYSKIVGGLSPAEAEYFVYRIELGKRIDRGELTKAQGSLMADAKLNELKRQKATEIQAENNYQFDRFIQAVGAGLAVGAAAYAGAAAANAAAMPRPNPQIICTPFAGRIICQ